MKDRKIEIDTEQCDRNIKTYGDVIRHMNNQELALFLQEMQAEIELGLVAVMRAKTYMHRYPDNMDKKTERKNYNSMYNFMEHRIKEEETDGFDIWGIENWQDLCQWESAGKKNFGMDIVY